MAAKKRPKGTKSRDPDKRARDRIAAASKRAKANVVRTNEGEYSSELGVAICQVISTGKPLYKAVSENADWPCEMTITRWARMIPEFAQMYDEARMLSVERRIDEIIEIADTDDNAAKARNRIEARKWLASKLISNKYGDKSTTEITGPKGGPVQVQRVIDVTTMSPDDLEALGRLLENAAQNGLEENG